ncbi:formate/nitrite transporter family protein [Cyclobacterium qasimii]|uniref:Formate/nitrite transporter family n=2 Tax=Cyclobacterium qasimii TaxID=1350429 RepID=S7V599_9BACT|nr:formate/nitrite transporter family protein [Cyclobacterium qasimii]EPR65290.1 Formate/nitrite transporter family [Cyclobacterium qasimii M12-11B]GEO21909.1 membrane protein [Cyclobacterium qasimii]
MKPEKKDQKVHQQDLEKKSNEIEESGKYTEILSRVIHEGEEIFKIKKRAIFLSACIAGLEIGFSYLLISTLYFLLAGKVDENIIFKLFGLVYPLGFIMVILGKSVLFTEQTSVLALPVLNGQRTILELLSIWGVVIIGNLLGGIVFVFCIGDLAAQLNLFDKETMVKIGSHILDHSYWVLLLSSVFAGWLMGLLTWILNSTTSSLTRILLIVLITGTIGFVGFHHSIVGNIEAFAGFLYSETISLGDYLSFLLLTLLGNGIGGSIVVALFKYRIFESNYATKRHK